MYGRVYTCFVQLGLSQNLGQEKQGGGGTLQNVCYPAMCIPLCGIFDLFLTLAISTSLSDIIVQILEIAESKLSWDRKASKESWIRRLGAKDAGNE